MTTTAAQYSWRYRHPDPGTDLTTSERRILSGVANGLTDRQISKELNLSEGTIHAYLARAYHRLGCNSRTRAVILAIHTGQLPCPCDSSRKG